MGRKVAQHAVRFDAETERILDETAKHFDVSRTDVINAALLALGRVSLEKRRAVLADYLLGGGEPKARGRK